MQAKRNDNAVPLNNRRRKNGEASHRVVSQRTVTLTDRTMNLSTTFENDQALDQSEDE